MKITTACVCVFAMSLFLSGCRRPVTVEDGSTVTVAYTLTADGAVVEKSDPAAPPKYVHGRGQMILGIEEALAGKRAGDKISVSLPPEKAYGARRAYLVREVPLSALPKTPPPAKGMKLKGSTPDGKPLVALIVDIKGGKAVLDFNHPLAGKALRYDIEIINVERK